MGNKHKGKRPRSSVAPVQQTISGIAAASAVVIAGISFAVASQFTRSVQQHYDVADAVPQEGTWSEGETAASSPCNMHIIEAADTPPAELVLRLRNRWHEPFLLRNAMGQRLSAWADRESFINTYGNISVTATISSDRNFDWAPKIPESDHRFILGGRADVRLATFNLSDFSRAMRNGSVGERTYCFHDITGSSLAAELTELNSMDANMLVARHGPRGCTSSAPSLLGPAHTL